MWRSSGVLYLPYIFRTLKRVYKPTVVISTKLLKMSSFCRHLCVENETGHDFAWRSRPISFMAGYWPRQVKGGHHATQTSLLIFGLNVYIREANFFKVHVQNNYFIGL